MPDERGPIQIGAGVINWSPDYKTERDMSLPANVRPGTGNPSDARMHLLSRDEAAIVALLKSLRPGQELRVIRDEVGGPLGYKVYDVIGADPT